MNNLKSAFNNFFYRIRSVFPKSKRGLSTLLLLLIVPITIIVLQFPQIFRQNAATTNGSYGFGSFGDSLYGNVVATIPPTVAISEEPTQVPPTSTPVPTTSPSVAPTDPASTPTAAVPTPTLAPTSLPTPTATVPTPTPAVFSPTPTTIPGGFSIVKAQTPPVIDGNPSEFVSASTLIFGTPTNNNAIVRAMWDDSNLYLAYTVQDSELNSSITQRDGDVWGDDAVEWFVDTQNNGGSGMAPDDYQGIVNTLNTQYDTKGSSSGEPDLSWNGTWESAVLKASANYIVEVKIPWNTIGLSSAPTAGTTLGMGFAVDDKDNASSGVVMYPAITSGFQDASKWQKVQLSGPANASSTTVSLSLLLHGLGKGGDSANPNSGGTENPRRLQRIAKIEMYNSQNQLMVSKDGNVSFETGSGSFKGDIDLGQTVPTGAYTVKVKVDQFLKVLVPGIQSLTQGQTNKLAQATLTTGDMNNDNKINILDYNILIDCYSDTLPAKDCADPAKKQGADITDDGDVNQFDYNLFLRELTNVSGE